MNSYYEKLESIEDVQRYVNEQREIARKAKEQSKLAERKLDAMNRALNNFIGHIVYKYCMAKNEKESKECSHALYNVFNSILENYEQFLLK